MKLMGKLCRTGKKLEGQERRELPDEEWRGWLQLRAGTAHP